MVCSRAHRQGSRECSFSNRNHYPRIVTLQHHLCPAHHRPHTQQGGNSALPSLSDHSPHPNTACGSLTLAPAPLPAGVAPHLDDHVQGTIWSQTQVERRDREHGAPMRTSRHHTPHALRTLPGDVAVMAAAPQSAQALATTGRCGIAPTVPTADRNDSTPHSLRNPGPDTDLCPRDHHLVQLRHHCRRARRGQPPPRIHS